MEMTADAQSATYYHRTMFYRGKEHSVVERAARVAAKDKRDMICRNDLEAAFVQLSGILLTGLEEGNGYKHNSTRPQRKSATSAPRV